ncbi:MULTISPECIES: MMPL family transporter [unclassified Sporosarcina]|uniref:MMPL family transporter n=1 Tax=unclassified Sporosarcina TaxID=2647733 RepID=UPI00203E4CC6|nr:MULTISPECIES: MMPL family transporter [unclassified Sporosarcina]GKV64446.1 membrane protein [Sporosarcina sp. NCCP-2331]GLB55191.1 membrane protein [Sporosarcina sp. NCCP-2378]
MHSFANFITKSYKWILAFWLILFGVMTYFAIQLPGLLAGDGFRVDGEHEKVMKIVSEDFNLPAETLFLVFDGKTDKEIESTLSELDSLGIPSKIVSPLNEKDQYTDDLSYAMLQFSEEPDDMPKAVEDIRDSFEGENGIVLTGGGAFEHDINKASQRDLMTAEAIGLPIAIIVLLFAFGTIVASVVPLLVGIGTVVCSLGILALLGNNVDLSIFVLNIVPMLGLALSIDFALLFISRYREELKKQSITDSVIMTIRTAGRSIIFSAVCVFIGLGAMLLIKVDIFGNIALGGMVVVCMAVAASLTLLPSVLLLLGERIHKGRLLKDRGEEANGWRKFANAVIKRPVTIAIVAFVLLAIALIPVRNMELTIPQIDSLPESFDTRQAFESMQDTFGMGNESTVFLLAERAGGWEDTGGLSEIKKLEQQLTDDPLVGDVSTIYTVSGVETPEQWEQSLLAPEMDAQLKPVLENFTNGDQLLVPVTLNASGSSNEAQDWVRDWSAKKTDWNLLIGGEPRFNQEIFDEIANQIVYVLLIIVVSTFFILMFAFRSLVIPIKAILMNILGLSATFGILVYIFQYGHFGLHPGTVALIIPVIVFSLVFGLSMDYEVFLISRMQEEFSYSFDNDKSTVEGLATTSKVITSAALIMIVLTGAFAFTDVMPVKQIGVGIAIAVAIDATIIRLLLVPSLMKLFGKWNWWLPFGKGLYRSKNQQPHDLGK